MKACAKTTISFAMQTHGDEHKLKTFENFIKLCDMEWSEKISSHALRSLSHSKFNKPSILPLAEDVNKLQMYLKTAASQLQQSLMEGDQNAWTQLCKVTLTQVVLLNRRRGGEAERMLVAAYVSAKQKKCTQANDDIQEGLSKVELALCNVLMIVEIEGKRGRKVPMLLTKDLQSQITTLIEKRSAAGVCESNVFIFARLDALHHSAVQTVLGITLKSVVQRTLRL